MPTCCCCRPGGIQTVEHNPRRRKEETFEALHRQFTGLAQTKPVLMIFEDLHWIDPTTQELLDLFIQRIDRLPVLLDCNLPPGFYGAVGRSAPRYHADSQSPQSRRQ